MGVQLSSLSQLNNIMKNTNLCRNCTFWRDKGWSGNEGIGICDNPKVIEQVKILSDSLLERFVPEPRDVIFISNSMRFNADFGCIHFEKI